MNIAMPLSSYHPRNVFLCDPVPNTVMADSTFTRILYSDPDITLVGLHLQLCVDGARDEQYYQKTRTVFDVSANAGVISFVERIETNILDMVDIDKKRVTKLSDQLRHGILRSATHASWNSTGPNFVLKVTGIWETDNEYGVTYKVTDATRLISTTHP
jgi:hypothetical protein